MINESDWIVDSGLLHDYMFSVLRLIHTHCSLLMSELEQFVAQTAYSEKLLTQQKLNVRIT